MQTAMYPKITFLLLLLCWLLPSGCSDENKPDNPAPEVSVDEAQNITRTSAVLAGTISVPSGSITQIYRFRYGTSATMDQISECSPEGEKVTALLQDLLPGTTYYYCLEAGNKKHMVKSPICSFTTIPNEVPQVQEITVLGQGPISIMVQCGINDNGGEEITTIGFSYVAETGEEKEQTATMSAGNKWHLRIGELEENTNYTIRAFAENKIGRTYSEPYHFRTGQAVIMYTAGTLSEIMDEEEKYDYTQLSIAGPLNGTDMRFIRDMLGKDLHGNNTKGKLEDLDLTDASIVAGGLSYDEAHYTENNVIGDGLFAELVLLKRLKLPETTVTIEQNAFRNCVALAELMIPENTVSLTPSSGCSSLQSISVVSANSVFSSTEGVLYDKSGEVLIWFPEGITVEELKFSPTLKSLSDYALQKCNIRRITLSNSITSLGKQVFLNSKIEIIVLSDNLKNIPHGLFQGCTKLTSVTLGSKSEFLGDFCFDSCPLKHLYVKASIPPVCNPNAFTGATNLFSECTLHVLPESLDLYRNRNTWKQFQKLSSTTF